MGDEYKCTCEGDGCIITKLYDMVPNSCMTTYFHEDSHARFLSYTEDGFNKFPSAMIDETEPGQWLWKGVDEPGRVFIIMNVNIGGDFQPIVVWQQYTNSCGLLNEYSVRLTEEDIQVVESLLSGESLDWVSSSPVSAEELDQASSAPVTAGTDSSTSSTD
jgi:hypothetical protein